MEVIENPFYSGDFVTCKDNFRVGAVEMVGGSNVCIMFDGGSSHITPHWNVRHVTQEEFNKSPFADIVCWSCDQEMSRESHTSNDGFCIHCGQEIEL